VTLGWPRSSRSSRSGTDMSHLNSQRQRALRAEAKAHQDQPRDPRGRWSLFRAGHPVGPGHTWGQTSPGHTFRMQGRTMTVTGRIGGQVFVQDGLTGNESSIDADAGIHPHVSFLGGE
jgi:hypothetical protein